MRNSQEAKQKAGFIVHLSFWRVGGWVDGAARTRFTKLETQNRLRVTNVKTMWY